MLQKILMASSLCCALLMQSVSSNAQMPTQPCGKNYIRIDGTTEGVDLGTGYNFTNQFTMMSWVRLYDPAYTGWSTIFGKHRSASTGSSWLFYISDRTPTIYFTNSISAVQAVSAPSSARINDASWHHLAATYDGSTLKIFIDGIQVISGAATGNVKSTILNAYIGTHLVGSTPTSGAKADYDESALFNSALTSTEIATIYANGIPSNSPNMVANFNFNNTLTTEPNIVAAYPAATIMGDLRLGTTNTAATFNPASPLNYGCVNQMNTFTINNIADASGYDWYLNDVLVQSATTNIFQKTWTSGEANLIQNIKAKATNACASVPFLFHSIYINDAPATPSISSQPPTPICLTNISTFVVTPVNYLTYEWSLNGNPELGSISNVLTKSWGVAESKNISVIAVNDKGCKSLPKSFATVVVNANPVAPTFIAGPTGNLCSGTSSTFQVSGLTGATYYWYANDALASQGVNQTSYTPTWPANGNSQIIKVTQKNIDGCTSPAYPFTAINIVNTPTQPFIAGSVTNVCINKSPMYTAINAQYATSYSWKLNSVNLGLSTQSITPSLSVGAGNSLEVTATNSGCTSAPYSINITGIDQPGTSVITGLTSVCPEAKNVSYQITSPNASNQYFYRIDKNVKFNYDASAPVPYSKILADFAYTPRDVAVIEVTATNLCGSTSNQLSVTQNSNAPNKPITACTDGTCNSLIVSNIKSGITNSYAWTGATATPANSPTAVWTNKPSAAFVTVSANGCSYTSFYGGSCYSGARKEASLIESTEDLFKVYPNPTEGNVIIETDGKAGSIHILNSVGQIVEQFQATEGTFIYNVTLSAKGIYVVRIKNTELSKSYKLIVE